VFDRHTTNSGENHDVRNKQSEEELSNGPECNASLFRGVENWDEHEDKNREKKRENATQFIWD